MTLVGLSDPKGADCTSATVSQQGAPERFSIPFERSHSPLSTGTRRPLLTLTPEPESR